MGRWWIGLGAALLLAASGVGIAVWRFDPAEASGLLVDAVQSATGRTLSIGGPIRLKPSLWPTLEISDVRLANLPGGSRPDMARAERIEAQISLLGLLRHRIDLSRLVLIGPNILFEQVGERPNWIFAAPAAPRAAPAAPRAAPAAPDAAAPMPSAAPAAPWRAGQFELRIRHVYVQNGMVTWRLPARTKVVGIRALWLDELADGASLQLRSTLVYSDNQPFRLDATARPTGRVLDPWQVRLAFAAFDSEAVATGNGDLAGHYDLEVNAESGALERLNALLPEMALPQVHGVKLATHLGNGPQPGDLPVVGATHLLFESADLGGRVPGLALGATELTLKEAGGEARIASRGRYGKTPFTLKAGLGVPLHPDGPATVPFDLGVESRAGAASRLALKGKLGLKTLRFARLDASLDLRTPALADLRPVLGPLLPALTDVALTGEVSLPVGKDGLQLRGARLRTGQGDLEGDGQLRFGPDFAMSGHWGSTRLDLDAVLQAFGIGLAPPSPPPAAGPVIPATRLPWALLHGPRLDLSGRAAALRFAGEGWRDVQLALRLQNGVLQLGPVRAASPAGPLEFALTADGASPPGLVRLSLQAPAVPLAELLRQIGLPGPARGTVRIAAQLGGGGPTLREVAASLGGSLSAVALDGAMTNRAFKGLAGAALDALGIAVPAEGDTALRCLGLAGTFEHGVGTFRTIALETSYLSLEGVGQVDLARETLALKLAPLAALAGSHVAVPVIVEGPFRAIKGRLNATGLEQLGLFVDALFGGDRPRACADAGLSAPAR